MKRILLIIVMLPFAAFAQTIAVNTEWTKEDRANVYEEAMNVTAKNRTLSGEQRESLSLCYLEEITKKYTKKEYLAKIDIELKRIAENTLTQCAKNIGVDLNAKPTPVQTVATVETKTDTIAKPTKKINEGNFTKEDIVGTWQDQNSKIFFNADATFLVKMNSGESGGGTFYINQDKNIVLEGSSVLKVVSFDGKTLQYKQTVTAKTKYFGITKYKKEEIFTAHKVD